MPNAQAAKNTENSEDPVYVTLKLHFSKPITYSFPEQIIILSRGTGKYKYL